MKKRNTWNRYLDINRIKNPDNNWKAGLQIPPDGGFGHGWKSGNNFDIRDVK